MHTVNPRFTTHPQGFWQVPIDDAPEGQEFLGPATMGPPNTWLASATDGAHDENRHR